LFSFLIDFSFHYYFVLFFLLDHSGLLAITAAAEQLPPPPLSASSSSAAPFLNIKALTASALAAEGSLTPHKTTISHPKKQRLKTKDDTASNHSNSAPPSPARPMSLSVATGFPEEATLHYFNKSNLTNSNGLTPINSIGAPVFVKTHSTGSSHSMNKGFSGMKTSPENDHNNNSRGKGHHNNNNINNNNNNNKINNNANNKNFHTEIVQMGIVRAAQQRTATGVDDGKNVTCNCKKSKCLKM
jgi:hypothetical protein